MPFTLPPVERDLTYNPADRRNQHWVPKAYLRQWDDPSTPQRAYIFTCPKDLSSPPTRRSAKRTFIEPNINTMTKCGQRNLRLESICHAVEAAFGSVRERIINGVQASNADVEAIVNFVAVQMVRTPKFRSFWSLSGLETHEAQLSSITDRNTAAAIRETVGNIVTNHKQILSLFSFPKALELPGNMRVRLYRSHEARAFLTSDAPCCVIDYKDGAKSPFESLAGRTANVLMALSPEVIVLLDKSDDPHEMWQIFPDHPIIGQANAMIWSGAQATVVLPGQEVRETWLHTPTSKDGSEFTVM